LMAYVDTSVLLALFLNEA